MQETAEKYIQYLDTIFGVEPEFYPISDANTYPPIHCLVYRDIPDKGYITGITCGLSFVDYGEWKLSRPELVISVESTDVAWALAAAHVADNARGKFGFHIGNTINFGDKIAEESEMTGFLVFFQSLLEKEWERIKLPGWDITLIQLYPLYREELAIIDVKGFKWFIESNPDTWNVKRRNLGKL